MTQPADYRSLPERARLGWLDRTWRRTLLRQPQMRAASLAILDVATQHSVEMTFVQSDDMIDAVVANRSAESFYI